MDRVKATAVAGERPLKLSRPAYSMIRLRTGRRMSRRAPEPAAFSEVDLGEQRVAHLPLCRRRACRPLRHLPAAAGRSRTEGAQPALQAERRAGPRILPLQQQRRPLLAQQRKQQQRGRRQRIKPVGLNRAAEPGCRVMTPRRNLQKPSIGRHRAAPPRRLETLAPDAFAGATYARLGTGGGQVMRAAPLAWRSMGERLRWSGRLDRSC
jgi:hypothetical protein